ncbi:MAG: TonB-dependent receptor [Parvularcula sp.]
MVRRSPLSILCSSTALAGVAMAAEPAPMSAPDEITVEGKFLSLDKVNAVKTPTPIIDVPQSLSIVTKEQIKDQAFGNIGDLLRYTPGLSVSQGEGHRDAIIIRGNQSTADFFIDGVRDDVQYFRPLYNIEQVEILRGANALLFGRGGGGGVINRVTKTAKLGEHFQSITASADSFGAYLAEGDVNFATGDRSAVRLNGFVERLDNHRDTYEGDRYGINPTLTLELGPETQMIVSYEYLNDDRTVDRGVPSVPVAGGPDKPLTGFSDVFFGSDQNLTTLEANILRTRLDHGFNDHFRGNLTLQYADYDKLYQNIYVAGFDNSVSPAQITYDGYQDTTQRENLIAQANLVGEFDTGRLSHTLLIGVERGSQDTTNARNDSLFADSNDDKITVDFNGVATIPAFTFGTPARNRASDARFTSAYVQDQIDISDQFKIILGGRFDRFDIDVTDIQNAAQFSRTDEEVTPRLGAIYKPANNLSLYASYSETFLPRSGEQFLTLNLSSANTDPQFYKNKEVGVKWDINSDLSLTSALFELEQESFTTVDPADPANLIVVDGSVTKGLEVQLSGHLTDRWYMSTGYSYLDGKVKDLSVSGTNIGVGGFDGNRTRQTPEHMLSMWNMVEINPSLTGGIGFTHQSEMFVREDNAVEIPSYTRVDAALFYDFDDNSRIQLNIENLLDKDYFPDAHSNDNISTGEPLNARVTFSRLF